MTAALVIELFGGAHQPQVPLLDEIDERYTCARITASDSNDKTQVGFNQFAACPLIACCCALSELNLFAVSNESEASNITQIALKSVFSAGCVFCCCGTSTGRTAGS